MKLFQLVSSRDSCNLNEAIEPGSSRGRDDSPTNDDGSFEKDSRSDISPVPRRKSKKNDVKDDLKSAVSAFNKLIENDPTKEFLQHI